MKRNKVERERERHGDEFFSIIFPLVFVERSKRVDDAMTSGDCSDALILFYQFFNALAREI